MAFNGLFFDETKPDRVQRKPPIWNILLESYKTIKILIASAENRPTLVVRGWMLNFYKMAKKVTSKKAASAASKVLRDGRTGKASKTAAGSALSQREKKKK
ncbi:MAG: hypothetical protein R2764_08250 [Bacteroidales bacterium]